YNLNPFNKDFLTYVNTDLFTIVLINARSVLNKMSDLRTTVLITKPSAILVTETWCSSSVLDADINIDGYSLHRTSRDNQRGGGCIIYIHSHALVTKVEELILSTVADSLFLMVCGTNYKMLVGCVQSTLLTSRNRHSTMQPICTSLNLRC
ncbi:hypothetical protein MN116_000155, partial [Schistosoma mekongi]